MAASFRATVSSRRYAAERAGSLRRNAAGSRRPIQASPIDKSRVDRCGSRPRCREQRPWRRRVIGPAPRRPASPARVCDHADIGVHLLAGSGLLSSSMVAWVPRLRRVHERAPEDRSSAIRRSCHGGKCPRVHQGRSNAFLAAAPVRRRCAIASYVTTSLVGWRLPLERPTNGHPKKQPLSRRRMPWKTPVVRRSRISSTCAR